MKIPGFNGDVSNDDPIVKDTPNFTWGEATKYGRFIPPTQGVTWQIVRLARALQPYRTKIGLTFRVTSWFRPADHNAAVGGVPDSSHIVGHGIDLVIEGFTMNKYEKAFRDWRGGIGIYRDGHIHLDLGESRKWYG